MENHSTEFETKVVDMLARLDTKMDTIVGAPGQIGRLPKIEEEVENLKKKYWVFGGVLIGVSGVVHWAIDIYRIIKGH